jgi:hypothetical protein
MPLKSCPDDNPGARVRPFLSEITWPKKKKRKATPWISASTKIRTYIGYILSYISKKEQEKMKFDGPKGQKKATAENY